MAVISSQTLSIDGIPNIGMFVLSAREQKVTFTIVTDLSNGLFVSMQTYRLHFAEELFFCPSVKICYVFKQSYKGATKLTLAKKFTKKPKLRKFWFLTVQLVTGS